MTDGIDYTIAAIPTRYRGRQYRSRLEARWAAFFDLLGFQAEYEPYDLGGWSPDFLLTGPYDTAILVEVKPITEFHAATAGKMRDACLARGIASDVAPLLVGTAPFLMDRGVSIGWVGVAHGRDGNVDMPRWESAVLAWNLAPDTPGIMADIWRLDPPYPGEEDRPRLLWSSLLALGSSFDFREVETYSVHCMGLWAEASNRVQWKGPGR